jgi:CCR4-NOT transcription complex subunit 4
LLLGPQALTANRIAEFRANIQKNQKKRAAEQRQKEAQKREAEKENRKNLVGVRVVQKNLVYVTGLTPTVREDELLKTLRKPEFFGQYGNILKISISSRKGTDGQNQSLGVYVTFEKKEDAARCIQAVNGSQNGDRVLRAQLGTTKYCSAWLRHEQCTNRQCMFLHELGDEEDSYSRQDLSSMNSINSQRPIQQAGTSRSASRQQAHPSPSPAVAQPMARSSSKDGSDNGEAPALPASANWARNPQVRSRRGSHATSAAAPSPAISNALPATAESAVEDATPDASASAPPARADPSSAQSKPTSTPIEKAKRIPQDALASLLKALEGCTLAWPKLGGDLPPDEFNKLYPPLFDTRGGIRRRALRAAEDSSSVGDQQSGGVREPSEGEPESSGSLALGGEPEDRDHGREGPGFDPRRVAQPPIQRGSTDGLFGQAVGSGFAQSPANLGSIGSRTMTPQQPAFMRQPANFVDHLSAQANLFQGQGHNRQGSRFSFANDGRDAASATTVKLAANPRIMAQQSSMMPSSFHSQPGGQYYATSMPGPPPGLKSTGTPPGVFGQHGFGSAAFGGASKDTNEMLQLFRGRGAGSQAHDAGKREYMFSSFPNQYPPSTSSTPAPASSHLATLYGSQPGAFQDLGSKQKKKGKKHRHANTSSSGGSGLVDLADPSILQARMQPQQHLQQQSNAGLGQGLFGGQSQGGYNNPGMMYNPGYRAW